MDKDLFEYLFVTGQVDKNLKLKEKCPQCYTPLEETNDNAYPYYCPKCKILISKEKTEGVEITK